MRYINRKWLLKISCSLTWIMLSMSVYGQVISGKVLSEDQEPLVGASIYWLESDQGTFTDTLGAFELSYETSDDRRLVVSYLGFQSDTLSIVDETSITVLLKPSAALTEVVVQSKRDGIIISNLNAIKTEQINETELRKAACCDLAGCFGTQATVQVHTTNVITNSKELRILGMSGVYNQVLLNGLPMIQGLSYTYGISSFPGTVVDNIFISKGANSVLQGYESISGQINVTTKDGDDPNKLFVNLYANSFGEKHLNANYAVKKGYWSNLAALHIVQPANRIDRDDDQFMDLPLLTRYSIANTLKYRSANEWGWNSKIGVRFLNEKRVGGQLSFDPDIHRGSTEAYGQFVQITQPEIWTKTGFRFDDYQSISWSASAYYQDQNSYFGTVKYDAVQLSAYSDLQYELNYLAHSLNVGSSLRFLSLEENINFTENDLQRSYDGSYLNREVIPGIYAENTMRFMGDRLTWIAGARADRHNKFGTIFTPRTLLKYDISTETVVRANLGTGWRTANIFSENVNLLVSSRDIQFEEGLLPERALNYGMNIIQKFDVPRLSGYLSADYYRTVFQNQIFPDYDTDPSKAIIKNYLGTSIGNGFQTELNLRFVEKFDFKIGYNFLDVFRITDGGKQLLPFNSKHRLLATASFSPPSNRYHIDVNAHWFGPQRLPNTSLNPEEFRRPDFSPSFTLVNAQFTYKLKKWEFYTGCENIFDFRQERPIVSWQDPFSKYFDTNSVWGPTRGREFYLGVRYFLEK